MKFGVLPGHSLGQLAIVLLLVFVNLLHPAQADDSPSGSEVSNRKKVRVGVITQQGGPHLGIYFPAIAK